MKKKYPLRFVVQNGVKGLYKGFHFSNLTLLSCGHLVPPSAAVPVKQRCRLCHEQNKKD